MDDVLRRVKKAVNWLIYREVAENERALAETLGYTKSSFSQLVNGRVPLSEKFVDRLCALDANINKVFILEGVGNLLKNDNLNGSVAVPDDCVAIPKMAWDVIEKQAASLASRDKQIDRLIDIIEERLGKGAVNEDAACADAG